MAKAPEKKGNTHRKRELCVPIHISSSSYTSELCFRTALFRFFISAAFSLYCVRLHMCVYRPECYEIEKKPASKRILMQRILRTMFLLLKRSTRFCARTSSCPPRQLDSLLSSFRIALLFLSLTLRVYIFSVLFCKN